MRRFAIVALICAFIAGCSTVTAVKSGTATWQQIATSTCTDLRTASTAASAAVAWSKIYFPNQQAAFTEVIEPLLIKASAGVDAYCAAASLVQDATGIQALLTKKAEILDLLGKVDTFIFAVKGS